MTETDYDTIDAILSVRRIDDAATTTLLLPELDPGTPYFPETPQGFRDTLLSHEMAKKTGSYGRRNPTAHPGMAAQGHSPLRYPQPAPAAPLHLVGTPIPNLGTAQ